MVKRDMWRTWGSYLSDAQSAGMITLSMPTVRNGNLEKGEFTRGKPDSTGGLGEHSKGPRW